MSAFSENPDLAKTFLLDYVNNEDVQLALFDAGGRPPAMTVGLRQGAAPTPTSRASAPPARPVSPSPAIPAMSAVWDTWKDAYSLIFTGSDPRQAFSDAAATIREQDRGLITMTGRPRRARD